MKNLLLMFSTSLFLLFSQTALCAPPIDSKNLDYIDQKFLSEEAAAVKRITAQWEKLLNAGDPQKIVALYDDSFILYATFSNKIDQEEKLLDYFTGLMKKKNFKVVFNEQNPRAHGVTAVDSGLYTFSFTDDSGKKVEVPARYTFVYVLTAQGWRIAEHHSSELPE